MANGTIQAVQDADKDRDPVEPRRGLPEDESRRLMMMREREMTVEERVKLFEDLSRDAAWVRRSARRVR